MRLDDLYTGFIIFESLESKMKNILQVLQRIEPDPVKAEKIARRINKADPTGDRALYTPWIAKQLAGGKKHPPNIQLEDLPRVKKTLAKFHGSKDSKGYKDHRAWENGERSKDVFSYKVFHDLEEHVDEFTKHLRGSAEPVKVERKPLAPGVDLLYQDKQVRIINVPKVEGDRSDQNGEAASKLGVGSKWCTTSSGTANNYIYNNDGLIIFQINPDAVINFPHEYNKDGSFAQATGDFSQFMDLKDRPIKLEPDLAIKLYEILKDEALSSFKILSSYTDGKVPEKYGDIVNKDFSYISKNFFSDKEITDITKSHYKYWANDVSSYSYNTRYFKNFDKRHEELEKIFIFLVSRPGRLIDALIRDYYSNNHRQQWPELESTIIKLWENADGYSKTQWAELALTYLENNDGETDKDILGMASSLPDAPPALIKKYGESILEKLGLELSDLDTNMRLALAIHKNERDIEAESSIENKNHTWVINYAKKFGRMKHIEYLVVTKFKISQSFNYWRNIISPRRWKDFENVVLVGSKSDSNTSWLYFSECNDVSAGLWNKYVNSGNSSMQHVLNDVGRKKLDPEVEDIVKRSPWFCIYCINHNMRSAEWEQHVQDYKPKDQALFDSMLSYATKFKVRIPAIEKVGISTNRTPRWSTANFLTYSLEILKSTWPEKEPVMYAQHYYGDTTKLEAYLKMACEEDSDRMLKGMVEHGVVRAFIESFKKACNVNDLYQATVKYGSQADIAFFANEAGVRDQASIESMSDARDMTAEDFADYAILNNIKLPTKYLSKILEEPKQIVKYAQHVLERRWMKGEKALLNHKDPASLESYAEYVIGGPWPAAEKYIANDSSASYQYAYDVLKGRFEAGESAIRLRSNLWNNYKHSFLDRK